MRRTTTAAAVLAATAITLTACGGGGDTESTTASGGNTPDQSESCTEDRVGGKITMGEYVMLPTFMPGQGAYGVRGGAESAAVYDRLMRWDPESGDFVPQLAESLESNEDNTVWTLKLREGVNFSNGDPLTAEDVAFTVGLHKDPATKSTAMTDAMQVTETSVVDPRTVEFTLTEPWAGFPVLLAGVVGEVIPQKAFEASSPEEWSKAPVGAGAFMLDEYIPGQRAVLTPNPEYYGGPVCPSLEFIQIPGSQGTFEAFQNNEIQLGFLRGAKFATMAQDADVQGFHQIISSGGIAQMNNGAAGYDGILTDARARQAVGHALDRELMDQRATGGVGHPTSALIADSSRFYDDQQGPQYDVDKAKALVEEVKADKSDWNGELTLLISDNPELVENGVVVKAMLDAVGFNVKIENVPVAQVAARQFTGDYELVLGGLAPSEADPASTMASALTPGGATNLTGVDDPRLTKAITELKAADDLDAQKEALANLQKIHNEIMPFTVFNSSDEFITVDESVKGVVPTVASTMLFDGAFVEK